MRKWFLFLTAMVCSIMLQAQDNAGAKWSFEAKQVKGKVYDLILKANVTKSWHLYSINQPPGEFGPVAMEIKFPDLSNIKLIGGVKEVGALHKEFDPNFEKDVTFFEKQVSFVQRVEFKDQPAPVKATIYGQVCTTGDNGTCILIDKAVTIPAGKKGVKLIFPDGQKSGEVPAAEGAESAIASATDTPSAVQPTAPVEKAVKFSYVVIDLGSKKYELRIQSKGQNGYTLAGADAISLSFNDTKSVRPVGKLKAVPAAPGQSAADMNFSQEFELLNSAEQIKGSLTYTAQKDNTASAPQTVEFSTNIPQPAVTTAEVSAAPADNSLAFIFGTGFLGGLLALLTPCVFPMIPLTVSFFTKKSPGQDQKKSSGLGKALIFGLSIIVIYVGLGFVFTRVFGMNILNEMSTNVWFNLAFFAIFTIFAFSFFGAFEIQLPASWANKADAQAEKGGLIGIFFVAFTLALVSFSCTGPIVGSLLVDAAYNGGVKGPIAGMLGFSVALALPFTIFAVFPSLMQQLPKSGGWLNSVKVTLGFLELALALKFLSTADLAYHADLLKREYFLAIWIIIFAMLGFYLLGKLKFSHDSDVKHISVPRLLLSIFAFSFAAYMIPGLFGAPLTMLSGVIPPHNYSEWQGVAMAGGHESSSGKDEIKPEKYVEIINHRPAGLTVFYDYEEALAAARKTGKPMLVDFTGWGCTNCRRMEDKVWPEPSVRKILSDDYILVSLYVDDRTPLPANETYFSDILNKEVNTLGRKNAELQFKLSKSQSQPYYLLLDQNEKNLADPRGYTPDVTEYLNFLKKGVDQFRQRQPQASLD